MKCMHEAGRKADMKQASMQVGREQSAGKVPGRQQRSRQRGAGGRVITDRVRSRE
jgi:hypothetical protein